MTSEEGESLGRIGEIYVNDARFPIYAKLA